jgi:excisionase family DNA binding protein
MKSKQFSPRQAAVRLGIRLDNLYALIWAGKLSAQKHDGRWLIDASALEQRLRSKRSDNNGTTRG